MFPFSIGGNTKAPDGLDGPSNAQRNQSPMELLELYRKSQQDVLGKMESVASKITTLEERVPRLFDSVEKIAGRNEQRFTIFQQSLETMQREISQQLTRPMLDTTLSQTIGNYVRTTDTMVQKRMDSAFDSIRNAIQTNDREWRNKLVGDVDVMQKQLQHMDLATTLNTKALSEVGTAIMQTTSALNGDISVAATFSEEDWQRMKAELMRELITEVVPPLEHVYKVSTDVDATLRTGYAETMDTFDRYRRDLGRFETEVREANVGMKEAVDEIVSESKTLHQSIRQELHNLVQTVSGRFDSFVSAQYLEREKFRKDIEDQYNVMQKQMRQELASISANMMARVDELVSGQHLERENLRVVLDQMRTWHGRHDAAASSLSMSMVDMGKQVSREVNVGMGDIVQQLQSLVTAEFKTMAVDLHYQILRSFTEMGMNVPSSLVVTERGISNATTELLLSMSQQMAKMQAQLETMTTATTSTTKTTVAVMSETTIDAENVVGIVENAAVAVNATVSDDDDGHVIMIADFVRGVIGTVIRQNESESTVITADDDEIMNRITDQQSPTTASTDLQDTTTVAVESEEMEDDGPSTTATTDLQDTTTVAVESEEMEDDGPSSVERDVYKKAMRSSSSSRRARKPRQQR
jgi:hypothetical protein